MRRGKRCGEIFEIAFTQLFFDETLSNSISINNFCSPPRRLTLNTSGICLDAFITMDTKAVIGLVDELQEDLEDLEESLQPILPGSLATTSRKLPLLDRAKLNVLLVYS